MCTDPLAGLLEDEEPQCQRGMTARVGYRVTSWVLGAGASTPDLRLQEAAVCQQALVSKVRQAGVSVAAAPE